MARSFNGSTQQLRTTEAYVSWYPATLSVWVKPASFSGSPYFFQFGSTSNATDRAGLHFETSGQLGASIRKSATTRTWVTTAAASTGVWVHACAVLSSSSSIVAYLNGVSTGSYTASNSPTWISYNVTSLAALERTSVSNYLNGELAEPAIWNVTLTAEEVASLAAGLSPQHVRPANITMYAPLFGRLGASGGETNWVGASDWSHVNSPTVTDHPRIIYPRRRSMIFVPSAAAGAPTLSDLKAASITATTVQATYDYAF